MAKQNHKQFFAFSMLRQPISFHVSYMNFFQNAKCTKRWCHPPLFANLTEENLLKSFLPNHQCLIMARKDDRKLQRNSIQPPLAQHECTDILGVLRRRNQNGIAFDWDWIGTLETLQNTTMPLLSYMLTGTTQYAKSNTTSNIQHSTRALKVSHLSEAGRTQIQQESQWDVDLYNFAANEYTMDMWDNFPKSKG